MDDKLILVFGRSGQVGSELARQLAPPGWRMRGLSRSDVDLRDQRQITDAITSLAPAVVINAAAYTAVDAAESDRGTAMAVNRDAPGEMAAACARLRIPFLHVSTDYVFDGNKPTPYVEDDPVGPLSAYGESKAEGEAAIRSRTEAFVILRTSWVFSPFGRNFVKTMIRLASRPEVKVVSDQRGAPTAAADIAAALLTIAVRQAGHGSTSAYGIFNYSGGGETSWHGFAAAIFAELSARGCSTPRLIAIEAKDYPAAARRPANSRLDCSRIAAVHGIGLRPWREALAACMAEILP